MATVYRAERQSDHLIVALKHLHRHISLDSAMIERFVRGAELMMELRHPHVAAVYEQFHEGDNYFQAEEHLSGGSLADYLASNGPVQIEKALIWCRQALLAVDYAHQKGIIHRDLKPGNLMLDDDGDVKVTDFGIARVLGSSRLTVTGVQLGTPAYMSPEQIQDPVRVTHLTDVYSMGVVLFELLTGKIPFGGAGGDSTSDFETSRAVVQDPPPRPRSMNGAISRKLESLMLRALEKDPNQRYGGGADFAAEIDRYLRKKSPIIPWPPRFRPTMAAYAGTGLLAFALGAVTSASLRKPSPQGRLQMQNGTSVIVESDADKVWISKKADNVIMIDLDHNLITIVGFLGVHVNDLRPGDPQVNRTCAELQEAKATFDAAAKAFQDASEQLSSATQPDASHGAAQPNGVNTGTIAKKPMTALPTVPLVNDASVDTHKLLLDVDQKRQEQDKSQKALAEVAQRWLDLKSNQLCVSRE
jgi:serine/threonine-protein kinase